MNWKVSIKTFHDPTPAKNAAKENKVANLFLNYFHLSFSSKMPKNLGLVKKVLIF